MSIFPKFKILPKIFDIFFLTPIKAIEPEKTKRNCKCYPPTGCFFAKFYKKAFLSENLWLEMGIPDGASMAWVPDNG